MKKFIYTSLLFVLCNIFAVDNVAVYANSPYIGSKKGIQFKDFFNITAHVLRGDFNHPESLKFTGEVNLTIASDDEGLAYCTSINGKKINPVPVYIAKYQNLYTYEVDDPENNRICYCFSTNKLH